MKKPNDQGKKKLPKKRTTTSTPTPQKKSKIAHTTLSEITPASTAYASLKSLSQILHLLHHRSKNQHRRSTWYKHFNTFRRTLASLLRELSPSPPPTWLPSRRKKLLEEKMKKAELRVGFAKDVLVGRWWVAFVQVVGDRQFAALGLVLVAALGSFCGSLGIEWEDEGGVLEGVDVESVLEEYAEGEGVEMGEEHDVGVVIQREEDDDEGSEPDRREQVTKVLSEEEQELAKWTADREKRRREGSPEPKKKKKKRKKGDAIDDLFAGLI